MEIGGVVHDVVVAVEAQGFEEWRHRGAVEWDGEQGVFVGLGYVGWEGEEKEPNQCSFWRL